MTFVRSREVRGILIVQGRAESENISSESIVASRNSATVRGCIFTNASRKKGDGNGGSFAGIKDQRPEERRESSSLCRGCPPRFVNDENFQIRQIED